MVSEMKRDEAERKRLQDSMMESEEQTEESPKNTVWTEEPRELLKDVIFFYLYRNTP